jgi:hypothetical protein
MVWIRGSFFSSSDTRTLLIICRGQDKHVVVKRFCQVLRIFHLTESEKSVIPELMVIPKKRPVKSDGESTWKS